MHLIDVRWVHSLNCEVNKPHDLRILQYLVNGKSCSTKKGYNSNKSGDLREKVKLKDILNVDPLVSILFQSNEIDLECPCNHCQLHA